MASRALTLRGAAENDRKKPRADQAAVLRVRRKLVQLVETDLDWWYEQMKVHVYFPTTQSAPAARILDNVIRSFLPERRENLRSDDAPKPKISLHLHGIGDRGTRAARDRVSRARVVNAETVKAS